MELIHASVVSILKQIDLSCLDAVMLKIEECGCESLDDCILLIESDICPPLKQIQCRKLLNAWKQCSSNQLSTETHISP